jgi:hypothetical protein
MYVSTRPPSPNPLVIASKALTPQFIISVPDADEVPHVQSYYPDRLALPTTEPSLPYPLEVAGYPMQYYTPPPGMNVVQMFKSPMMIMMIFSAVMAIGLPKLTVRDISYLLLQEADTPPGNARGHGPRAQQGPARAAKVDQQYAEHGLERGVRASDPLEI